MAGTSTGAKKGWAKRRGRRSAGKPSPAMAKAFAKANVAFKKGSSRYSDKPEMGRTRFD